MKRIMGVVTSIALVFIGLIVAAGPASAHTDTSKATCDNLHVALTSYATQAGKSNKITVTVDDAKVIDTTFGQSYTKDIALNKYVAHTWVIDVVAWDGSKYNVHKTGTTTPCEKPTQPQAETQTDDYTAPNCREHLLYHYYRVRTAEYFWNGSEWKLGPWSDWKFDHVTVVRPTTDEECGVVTPPVVTPPTPQPPHHVWANVS